MSNHRLLCLRHSGLKAAPHFRALAHLFLFASVDILAVADLDDVNHQYRILDCIKNAISSLPNSKPFETRELQCTRRSRVVGERLNTLDDTSSIGLRGDRFEFFTG